MHTKTQKLMIAFWAITLTWAICSMVYAGHSRNNGTCTDDAVHYQNMIVNGKRSDAPLYEESKAMRDKANARRMVGKWAECEELMEEALRMIRKPYPTE